MATLTGDWQKDRVKVTFGLIPKKKDHYGIMMYHKNRLIKAYEKVGCQLKVEETDGSVSHHANYNQCLPSSQMSHVSMSYRPRARGEVSGSSESLSVTSSNLLTTSKTSSTPKSTGTTRQQIWERIRGMGKAKKKNNNFISPFKTHPQCAGHKAQWILEGGDWEAGQGASVQRRGQTPRWRGDFQWQVSVSVVFWDNSWPGVSGFEGFDHTFETKTKRVLSHM